MKTITLFETTDGCTFENEREAKIHQEVIDTEPSISDYITAAELEGKSASMAWNRIRDYVHFLAAKTASD